VTESEAQILKHLAAAADAVLRQATGVADDNRDALAAALSAARPLLGGAPNPDHVARAALFADAVRQDSRYIDVEVDDDPIVSLSASGGAYVQCWAYVSAGDVEPPQYYEATVFYQTESGGSYPLGDATCIACSVDEARDRLRDAVWDPRLDAASARIGEIRFRSRDVLKYGCSAAGFTGLVVSAPSRLIARDIVMWLCPECAIALDDIHEIVDE